MDSLLATYSSSDEEQEDSIHPQSHHNQTHKSTNPTSLKSSSGAFFSSIPPPKSSSQSLSSSITPPKSQTLIPKSKQNQEPPIPNSSSSLFSILPQPKTQILDNPEISLLPKPQKKVVQFRPPVNPSLFNPKDDDEDSDEEKMTKRKSVGFETPTVKSFLSSIPAPRNSTSFGALPTAAGTGRRSVLEADLQAVTSSEIKTVSETPEVNVGYDGLETGSFVNYDGYGGGDASNLGAGSIISAVNYDQYGGGNLSSYGPVSEGHGNYESYGEYGNYEQYESRWIDRSGEVSAPEVESVGTQISSSAVENVIRIGKRGRNDIPHEVVEVKQDELMKNRPREDKAKSTGIAFGPAYQPVSAKGKPTKLHKRKHQIGSLYFDMRQKESELAERRSKGFLTKAETHAKYGW